MKRIRTNEQAKALQQEIKANQTDTPTFGVHNDIRQCAYNYDHPYCSTERDGVEFRITDGFIRKHRGERFKSYILYVDGQAWHEFFSIKDAKKHLNEVYVVDSWNNHKVVHSYGSEEEARVRLALRWYDDDWATVTETFEEYLEGFHIVTQAQMYKAVKEFGSRKMEYWT